MSRFDAELRIKVPEDLKEKLEKQAEDRAQQTASYARMILKRHVDGDPRG